MPDFNEALGRLRGRLVSPRLPLVLPYLAGLRRPRTTRVIAMGIKREYRQRGIDAALIAPCLRAMLRDGYERCEISWILEDNVLTRRIGDMFGGTIYKRYGLYEMGASKGPPSPLTLVAPRGSRGAPRFPAQAAAGNPWTADESAGGATRDGQHGAAFVGRVYSVPCTNEHTCCRHRVRARACPRKLPFEPGGGHRGERRFAPPDLVDQDTGAGASRRVATGMCTYRSAGFGFTVSAGRGGRMVYVTGRAWSASWRLTL